jgi:hypothetical protein
MAQVLEGRQQATLLSLKKSEISMNDGLRYLQDDEPEIVDGYRDLDVEGKAVVLATVRKLAKDVEARMVAAGFVKMALTPEEFQLIMLCRAANAKGKAWIMAAAEAAPKRNEAELDIDDTRAPPPGRSSIKTRHSTDKANVVQEPVAAGKLPDAFFAAARRQEIED